MSRLRRVRPSEPRGPVPLGWGAGWIAPLGNWGGVWVGAHVSFLVAVVLAAGACIHSGSIAAWCALGVYLLSLAAHEVAHVLAAGSRFAGRGGAGWTLVLGPVGGQGCFGRPADPQDRVFVAMAGPVASLTLVIAGMGGLAGLAGPLPGELLLDPTIALQSDWQTSPTLGLASLLVAINWPLFFANTMPSAPFDGGVALRAWLALGLGTRRAGEFACALALLVAAALLGAAVALVTTSAAPPVTCLALAGLAVVIAFGARVDAAGLGDTPGPPAAGSEAGGVSLTDTPLRRRDPADTDATDTGLPSPTDRWNETRLDAVLAKVHDRGIAELTANERAILQRASEAFRSRRRGG